MPLRTTLLNLLLVTCCLSAHADTGGSNKVAYLLFQKPFVGEVTEILDSPTSFKLTIHSPEGDYRYASTSLSALDKKCISQLQQGRRYAFPQCFIDCIGLNNISAIVRAMKQEPPWVFAPPHLLELGQAHPFRARVLDQGLDEKGYSIVLQATDSRLYHVSGSFTSPLVKRTAEHLRRGETFEFPAALDDALLTESERSAKARPKSAEAKVLARYIGTWRGTVANDPQARITMNCHWTADGTGIWRELTFEDEEGSNQPPHDISLVTFDSTTQCYLATNPAPAKNSPAPLQSTWNEAKRTFTTTLPAATNGQTRINTAVFSAENRIDWKTVTEEEGKPPSISSGSYTRTSKDASPAKLAPPSRSSDLAALIPRDKILFSFQSDSGKATSPRPFVATDFFDLCKEPAFRGKVARIDIYSNSIHAKIEDRDFRRYIIRHVRDENWDQALRIAKRLEQGGIYEFPEVLADDYQPTPADFVPMPTTNAMRALSAFIGEWRMNSSSALGQDPKDSVIIRYFWSNDGTGLWREVNTRANAPAGSEPKDGGKNRVHTTLTTYNDTTQSYLETSSVRNDNDEKVSAQWDAQTQTYSWKAPASQAAKSVLTSGTRRIVSPDHFEYHHRSIKPDGSLVNEGHGYYERIKP